MLVAKYILFACIATACNLLFQWLSFWFYDAFGALFIAMFTGTLAGLVAKYVLDKHFIFYHDTVSKTDNAKTFGLYTLMGVVTTAIFWITEMAFDWFIDDPNAKYVGAIVGLSIGYIIKYFLDKKYVFVQRTEVS